jgi:hypothetical protein
MKSSHLVCLRRRLMMVKKIDPQEHFYLLEDINTLRKYLIKFNVDNIVAAVSNIETEVYRVQQKAKKEQLTLMVMWKR